MLDRIEMVNRDRSLLDFRQDVSALALLSNCISLQIGSVFEKQNCEQLSFCFEGITSIFNYRFANALSFAHYSNSLSLTTLQGRTCNVTERVSVTSGLEGSGSSSMPICSRCRRVPGRPG